MPGRYASSGDYRYGFNGKEMDNEVKGSAGTQYDYGFRIYDPRLGKFLSVDPLTGTYPMFTPYQYASNTPIQAIDLDGLEGVTITVREQFYEGTIIQSVTEDYTGPDDGRVLTIFHGLDGGTTEIWTEPFVVYYEPSVSEKIISGAKSVNDAVNNFNQYVAEIPSKIGTAIQRSAGDATGPNAGTLEGEQGLIKANKGFKTVGTALIFTPAAPIGEGILLFSDAIDTGLDFKNPNVSAEEATFNLGFRLATFGLGSVFKTFKGKNFTPKNGFESQINRNIDGLTEIGLEGLETELIQKNTKKESVKK